jgi:hypothetical protein
MNAMTDKELAAIVLATFATEKTYDAGDAQSLDHYESLMSRIAQQDLTTPIGQAARAWALADARRRGAAKWRAVRVAIPLIAQAEVPS